MNKKLGANITETMSGTSIKHVQVTDLFLSGIVKINV